MRPLGEIVEISKARIEPLEHPKTLFNYVGLENIESHAGRVLNHGLTYGKDIKSTKNVFGPGEILFGKLRPNLNKVHLAIEEGICSTDIYVLKPRVDIALGAYVAYFLRSPIVLRFVTGAMAGANLPRIGQDALLAIRIPVPPLAEQERIVKLLDEADALRKLRAESDRRTAELIPALFYEMFSCEPSGIDNWPTRRLVELTTRITKGESPGWQGFEYTDCGPAFVTSENVRWGYLDATNLKRIPEEFHHKLARSAVNRNDVLINLVGASIGRSCLVPKGLGDTNINQAVAVITCHRDLNPVFLATLLLSSDAQAYFHGGKVEGARANISLSDIRQYAVAVPPVELQIQFADQVSRIEKLATDQARTSAELERVISSLTPTLMG
ncbi:hypothetical protein BH23CHL5_BH23CHL5_25390 [soil metagenome]